MTPGLADDLDEVVRRLAEVHPDAVASMSPDAWAARRADALAGLAEARDPAGFWWVVAPLVAAVGDGHTVLWPPDPAHAVPWELELGPGGAWVRGWGGDAGPALPPGGARLVSVDGIPVEALWEALSARFGGETDGFVSWRVGREAWRVLPIAVERLGGVVDGTWRVVVESGGRAREGVVSEVPAPPDDPRRGWVNAWFVDDLGATAWPAPTVPGVLVDQVVPGGAAARAGLRGGDVVVAVDGAPTTTLDALHAALGAHRRGDRVVLSLSSGAEVGARAGRWRPWPTDWSFAWSEDALVVDLDAFHDPGPFAVAFAAALAARPVSRVVVDLRGNDGGDAQMPEVLCARLCRDAPAGLEMVWRVSRESHRAQRRVWGAWGPAAALLAPRGSFLGAPEGERWRWQPDPAPLAADRFDGPIDVLVDGGTYSASVYAAYLLRDHAGARLVGEPPGSGPSFHAHAWTAPLPATGLALQVATATFRVRSARGALVPDVPTPGSDALAVSLGRRPPP